MSVVDKETQLSIVNKCTVITPIVFSCHSFATY